MVSEDIVVVPHDLATRLSGWHSSMYDPIYAVSSSGIAGKAVDRKTFGTALNSISQLQATPHHEHSQELLEIEAYMRSVLGLTESGVDVERTIAHGMARTMWALAWADEAEERGESLGAVELTAVAPDTPTAVLEHCEASLREMVEMNPDSTVTSIFESTRPEGVSAYDFGHELVMAMTGHGGDIDFRQQGVKLPDASAHYFDFVDEWISE